MTLLRIGIGILILGRSLTVWAATSAATGPMPRTILALYNSKDEPEIRFTRIHRVVEMPLNHLGLIVHYRDINSGLPSSREMDSVVGIVTWFLSDAIPNPSAFMSWAEAAMESGKKLIIMGDLGVNRDYGGRLTPLTTINHFLAKLGLRNEWSWTRITYDAQFIYKDPAMVEFERPLTGVLPPFDVIKKIDPQAKSYLVLRRGNVPETESHLVVIGPNGGFVAEGYTIYRSPETPLMQLYLNPFEFFRLAFDTDRLPKLDTTTLYGRRIFYSHLDGDGWRNLTEIGEFKKAGELAAKVILERVIKAFPDLPITVAPIVADIDPEWYGNSRSLASAREILSQPNVEAGSHTYSHPLIWEFFVKGDSAAEKKLIRSSMFRLTADAGASELNMHGHELPRSYYLRPFQLGMEINGSAAFINALLPPGKKVEIFQWSGDTLPYEAAVSAAYAAGLRNINGGDTRLDQEYPSYAWVAPLGRQVGNHWQIYASNSNENTYTDMWRDRYFGFKDLIKTLENTEKPRRIKPFNIYFHMYSGQKLASLNALLANLSHTRTQEIVPITTGNYAAIANGFYSARIISLGDQSWRIEDRGALQTVRFDRAGDLSVDLGKCRGVIGLRRYQGSLYVALDEAEAAPIVTLKNDDQKNNGPGSQPYLIQARWKIWNMRVRGERLTFSANGFGPGEMIWKVPYAGRYNLSVTSRTGSSSHSEILVPNDCLLKTTVDATVQRPVQIAIVRVRKD